MNICQHLSKTKQIDFNIFFGNLISSLEIFVSTVLVAIERWEWFVLKFDNVKRGDGINKQFPYLESLSST